MAKLSIVGTPIGNLEDITSRALRILKEADLVLCEDTRVTAKLLSHYQIQTLTLSYHQHSRIKKIDQIIALLKQGKNLALVSDAGTPGIHDPGNLLIKLVLKEIPELNIEAIPGPSALTASASISGFNMDRFWFLGFLPIKNKRQKLIDEIIKSQYPVIIYESTYRIIKTIKEITGQAEQNNKKLELAIFREMTKKFESVYRGSGQEVLEKLSKDSTKGEFVVIIRIY